MRTSNDIPELAIVRVVSAGGPYHRGDILSLAFSEPSVGRLAAHGESAGISEWRIADSCVPEMVSAVVSTACATYGAGIELTLSFIDPHIARIRAVESLEHTRHAREYASLHPIRSAEDDAVPRGSAFTRAPLPEPFSALVRNGVPASLAGSVDGASRDANGGAASRDSNGGAASRDSSGGAAPRDSNGGAAPRDSNGGAASPHPKAAAASPNMNVAVASQTPSDATASPYSTAPGDPSPSRPGALVRLQWTPERVRRFISVVDRLFTVDRLGWYRHALAMRLLVPDEIVVSDERTRAEMASRLHELRAAVAQTFGRPLLGAFMPNFSVDTEWLETLDSPPAARALAALREMLLPLVDDRADAVATEPEWTIGSVLARDLSAMPATSLEALLPVLIPTMAKDAALGARLADYRRTLVDAFGQTVRSSGAVRLGAMTEPNHALDDRLWQLVGAVGAAFGEFPTGTQTPAAAIAAQA